MDAVGIILLIGGIAVMLYASSQLRSRARAGWEDVFTPIHGGEESAIDYRSELHKRGIESRMRYPGVAGSPVVGMSGATEVWVSVRKKDAAEARTVLGEILDARRQHHREQGKDE